MFCNDRGNEIEPEPSAVPFWVMAAVLFLWQLAVSVLPEVSPAAVAMGAAGFGVTVVLAGTGLVDSRRFGAGAGVTALVAFALWYAYYAVSRLAMARSGLGVYENVATAEALCDTVTLVHLWPWILIILAGLAGSGKLKTGVVFAAVSAAVLAAISLGALFYLLSTPVGQQNYAHTYIVSRLCSQWLLRLGMLCAACSWASGRTRGWPVFLFFVGAPICAAVLALAAGMTFPVEAVFWAMAAIYVGFGLVGLELAVMKRSGNP